MFIKILQGKTNMSHHDFTADCFFEFKLKKNFHSLFCPKGRLNRDLNH